MMMFRKHPLYWFYGLSVIGLATWAESRGFSFASISESQVPKSVRDNPGAFRSSYGSSPRYTGGK
jgi:hypothetical protein